MKKARYFVGLPVSESGLGALKCALKSEQKDCKENVKQVEKLHGT